MRDVLLVGGGHSHALLIRKWAMQPLAGVRLTLVSDGVMTPYSGMLPGLVAGHYTAEEVHIDLMRLCTSAGVRFINARMTAIDVDAQCVSIEGRPPLYFDVLSLDTGSTPDLSVPGAAEFSTPVKPVHAFHARWLEIRKRLLEADPATSMNVGVVGSGAGGFEIAMAMRHALPEDRASVHWFLREQEPLRGRPARVRRRALRAAHDAGVVVHTDFDVSRVAEGPVLHADDNRDVALDELLWCTGAVGPGWVADAGFEMDQRGFVHTDAYLRSVSHPMVYATGDIGTQRDTPSPKAGVYAVRQAPYLYENLRQTLLGKPLRAYRPQHDFLSLMATGPKQAIASRGPVMVFGALIWRWKDHIDQAFMQRVRNLPPMQSRSRLEVIPDALIDNNSDDADVVLVNGMRCRGCGAKVAGDVLDAGLARLSTAPVSGGVLKGLAEAGDAAVFDPQGQRIVQSVDQLSALLDDPWLFARIAVRHALADVLSQGAKAHSAQLLLTLPPASARVQQRELDLILAGAASALEEEGMTLLGGHSAEGPELQIGLVVNGFADPGTHDSAAECQVEDQLLLTRPLGTGVLFAAAMRGAVSGGDLSIAIDSMQSSQRSIADTLHSHGARIATDVTGFGLAGHLERLLAPTGLFARVDLSMVPVFDAAYALAARGIQSSLYPANAKVLDRMQIDAEVPIAWRRLIADPQTAGGFLCVIPESSASQALSAVQSGGAHAALIGSLRSSDELERHHFQIGE